uniref:Uncharacterized protein n=1 Tax=Pyramimonas obovata TaxID=1411642 RepID=A0A7S0QZL8_9CHLO
MTSNKTVEFLKRYKGLDGGAPRKDASRFIGTHQEPLPTYPSMYKRRMPGDIGWNVEEGERGRKKSEGESTSSTDCPLTRHCKVDGIGTLDAHQKTLHQFLRLPGQHTSDFLRECQRTGSVKMALPRPGPLSPKTRS